MKHTKITKPRRFNLLSSWKAPCITMIGLFFVDCGGNQAELQQEISSLKSNLTQCQSTTDQLQAEIITLKKQLAQALANPGSIKVDPSALMIEGKPIDAKPREGTLTQKEVIATMQSNKSDLQRCYERAMKRNSSLHHQQITLNIGFSVNPTGNPSDIAISPNFDADMNSCMRKAILRWRFPAFRGQPVGVEVPLPLIPKK